MKNTRATVVQLFAFSLFLSIGLKTAPVLAQNASAVQPRPDVESILSSKKVTTGADKKEVLIDAKDVKPGEVIEYRAIYTNKGKAPVTNLTANLPIPAGTEFQRGSVQPAIGVKAALSDGKFDAIPLKRKVKLPDGREVEQEVPLDQYRALQWSLGELAVGKSVTVVARVRVSDTPAGPAPAPAKAATPATPSTGGQK